MYFQFLLVLILPTTTTALVCHVYLQSLEGGKLVKVPDWTMQADGCSACVAYTRNNQYVAGCLREKNKRLLNVMPNTTCTSDDELSCNDDSCCCKSEACFDTLRERLGKADISGETCVVQREDGSRKHGNVTFLRESCASCETREDKDGVETFCKEKPSGQSSGTIATAFLVALSLLIMA